MKISRYRKFIRKFNREGAERRIPRRAMFELTYGCNFKCVHCFTKLKSERRELFTGEVFSVLDEMCEIGVFHITFSGGEIFTRPDAVDIIGYARKIGLEVALLTNGSLITEDIADWLIEHRVRNIEISFLGATPETFEEITGIPGSYDRVLETVRLFKQKGVIVTMKTCVLDMNLEEVDKIMMFAKSLGVSFRYSQFVTPALDCDMAPTRHRISPEEFIDIRKRFKAVLNSEAKAGKNPNRKKVVAEKRESPEEAEDGKLFRCLAGRSMIFVNPYGQIKPCIVLPIPLYDISNNGLKDGWEKMKEFVDVTKSPQDWKCAACELKDFCGVCPARAYLNTGDIFGCPEYFKEVARIRKKRYEEKTREEVVVI